MTVLTLAGKPIDWNKPPKATAKVLWSQKTSGGKKVIGSLRTIAHVDYLNSLAKKKFNKGLVVIQGPYNTGVKASAGTHDYDACLDVQIPGVAWSTQQAFFRTNGFGSWHRTPPSFSHHIHGFTLPPREGKAVGDDFKMAGFKVGKYVDGGWSTAGKKITSSQIDDYYAHRNGLSGHAHDSSWFPKDITATIFNLNVYIASQKLPVVPRPISAVKPKPCPAAWNKMVHLPSDKGYMDYKAGINTAASKKIGIDIDARQDKQGTAWAGHWDTISKNGVYDPKGKIKASAKISQLTTAEVSRLRTKSGNKRLYRLVPLIEYAASKNVRVECELKTVFTADKIKRILARPKIKAMHKAAKLQFKILAEIASAVEKCTNAQKGGGVTLLTFTGYTGSGIPKAAWPQIDYTRGTPKWR